ncbi:hypothetical protein AJ79_03117 [Helicocarpus griseus UAMH5409]|uniref:Fungal N-terminal domain-containing protein n=1 Tax=Helicocarpus griseus UAMH5409 TaxID=1447875 RepID=A0A2B7XZD0_9EURO|nr:hypothetical protein AJ79_03117 [Helicocarpus griseus UAMH5409]
MADPVSITGTAVGIVSLGLQVCNGLTNYYDSWKHCEHEVGAILSDLKNLAENLRLLEKTLKLGNFDPELKTCVETSVLSCRKGILSLRRKLEKIKLERNHKIQGKAQLALIKSLYPFKQRTIVKLVETITSVKGDVCFALQELNLDVVGTAVVELKEVRSSIDALNQIHVGDERRDIHKWLSPPDPFSNHYAACQARRQGTGKWFLEGEEYATWKTAPNSALCLYGIGE